MSNKRILLTGGTGLVGSGLTQMLLKSEFDVIALSRRNQVNINNINWFYFDISDNNSRIDDLLIGVDYIIHNAACIKSGKTIEEQVEIQKSNVIFTERLLKAAVKNKVKKIIFTSGFNIIKKPLPDLILEESIVEPITPYAISKHKGELLVLEYSKTFNLNYCILRLSSPVNFNFNNLPDTVLKRWILAAKSGNKILVNGSGGRSQDFVASVDIAKAYHTALDRVEINGTFNIASGSTISMLKLAQIISNKFKCEIEFGLPDGNEFDKWYISIEKAKRLLSYQPEFTSESLINKFLEQLDYENCNS
jgi:nucleoside-diphosphate-sugar epimerase